MIIRAEEASASENPKPFKVDSAFAHGQMLVNETIKMASCLEDACFKWPLTRDPSGQFVEKPKTVAKLGQNPFNFSCLFNKAQIG